MDAAAFLETPDKPSAASFLANDKKPSADSFLNKSEDPAITVPLPDSFTLKPVDPGYGDAVLQSANDLDTTIGKTGDAIAGQVHQFANQLFNTPQFLREKIGISEPQPRADVMEPLVKLDKGVVGDAIKGGLRQIAASGAPGTSGLMLPEVQDTAQGVGNAVQQFGEGLTSPAMIAAAATGKLAPDLAKPIMIYFWGDVVKTLPEEASHVKTVLLDPNSTTEQKTEALTQAGIHTVLAGGLSYHIAKDTGIIPAKAPNFELDVKPLPDVEQAAIKGGITTRGQAAEFLVQKADEIKPVAPLTAEALKEVATAKENVKDTGDALNITTSGDAAKLTELTTTETLTPEQQAEKTALEEKSKANNSKAAWAGTGLETLSPAAEQSKEVIPNEEVQKGDQAEEVIPSEVKPPVSDSEETGVFTAFKPAKMERPWDIIDELKNSFGTIRNKKSSKPGSEGFYDEGYKTASSGHGRELFSSEGSGPDEALQHLIEAGLLGKDATVGDMWTAIDRASGHRKAFARGELPEQKADAFHKAMDEKLQSNDKQVMSVGSLSVGDTFTLKGEKFTVKKIDPDTGEVHVQDGKKFGAQTIPEGAEIAIDKRSHTPVEKINDPNDPLSDNYQPEMVGMGGAVPGEFENSQETPTGTKNATVDRERAKRGLPPAVQPARREFGEVWDNAMAEVDRAPETQDNLIEELRDNPRAVTDRENALLLQRQIDLQNEFGKATRDLAQAYEDGRLDDVAREKTRVAGLSDKLLDIYNIGKTVGTETGRGLNARKMMANEDFTLAQMELQKRGANGGRPLTDAERTEIQQLHDKINATQKAYDDYVTKTDQRISDMESKAAHEQIVKDAEAEKSISPHIFKVAEKIVSTLDRRADLARARLKERLGRTSAGLDPTILIDLAEIGAAHISHMGLDFAKWSAKMVSEFGDVVKPHLDEIYKESQRAIDELGDKMGGKRDGEAVKRVTKKMDTGEKRELLRESIQSKFEEGKTDISFFVQKLARTFVEDGIRNRDELIDAVHQVLTELDPRITRRETMDAISGYGKFSPLTKDQISVELRDLKGQMQQVGKLEDMQSGQAPAKTGVERRAPSDEERRLIQQVNEMKKKGGFTVTDPAKQLKGALDSIKTRLKNQISDLGHQIATKAKIVKDRTPVPYDREALDLKAQRDALKEQYDAIFTKKGLTDEQRLAAATKAVEKSIAEYERRIKENDLHPTKAPSKTPNTPELDALRARRDALKEEFEHLKAVAPETIAEKEANALESQKKALEKAISEKEQRLRDGDLKPKGANQSRPAANPEIEALKQKRDELTAKIAEARKSTRVKKTPEEIALKAMKTRLANRTAELTEKLRNKDFSPRARKPATPMDAEATRLKVENERAKQQFQSALLKDRYANRTTGEKVADTFVRWRRAFVLSGPVTIAKLTSAAAMRMVITPAEEAVGWALSKLPVIRRVSKLAPREGGFSAKAEAKAITEGFTKGAADAWKLLTTGKSDLEALYGKETGVPRTAIDFIGSIHGALKTIPKRAEFSRSFEKRIEFNIRKGVDVTDPLVQTRIAMEAYRDANRSIFLQDSRVVSAYKRALRALEEPNKVTGKISVPGKIAATGLKMMMPVVKVPTNIVGETLQYAIGTITGSTKLALAIKNGVETLHPEEADMIMRHLKKGSLGATMILTGYLLPQLIGGYYQTGKKQGKDEVAHGNMKVGNVEIPKYLLHNPALENLQIGATIRHVADSKLRKRDKDTQGIPAGIMAAGLGLTEEVPFVREQLEIGKLLNPYERGPWLGYQAKSFIIPQGVQWIADHTDTDTQGNTIKRKPEGALQYLESGIPGLRKNVPPAKKK
jgi:hypothetical protein